MAAKQKSEETGSPSAPGRSEESGPTSPLGEIEQGPSAAERFLEANGKKLLLLVGLAVIGIGALIVASGLKEVQEEKAGEGTSLQNCKGKNAKAPRWPRPPLDKSRAAN